MVLYLNESLLTEAVSQNEVANAIRNKQAVIISYTSQYDNKGGKNSNYTGPRYIEPYAMGYTSKGNLAVRCYQYYGSTKRGTPKWKLFILDNVDSWEPQDAYFEIDPQARGWAAEEFNANDNKLTVIASADVKTSSQLSDYEKLKAKTAQLKKNKPININQVNNKKEEASQQRTPSGPLQTNTYNEKQPTSSPINMQKNTVSEPIVGNQSNDIEMEDENGIEVGKQTEHNQEGPITNSTTPKQSQSNVMNSDEFKKMIQRNLAITNKEKAARGRDNFGNKI